MHVRHSPFVFPRSYLHHLLLFTPWVLKTTFPRIPCSRGSRRVGHAHLLPKFLLSLANGKYQQEMAGQKERLEYSFPHSLLSSTHPELCKVTAVGRWLLILGSCSPYPFRHRKRKSFLRGQPSFSLTLLILPQGALKTFKLFFFFNVDHFF